MALSVPNQSTGTGFTAYSSEQIITPTAGNWLVAVVSIKSVDGSNPQVSVGDWARNLWTLVYSGTVPASTYNSTAQILTQVWVAPAVQYAGWPNLGVYTYALYASAFDVATGLVNVFEVAGMGSGFLTVDSVTVATASGATSLSITLPAPAGGADCLMVGCAGTDNSSGTISVSSAGWTALTQATGVTPSATLTSAWRESTASQTVSWSSTVSTNWAAVAVAIRVTGTAPPQPNPAWPAIEFQLGLGQNLSTPISAVQWTTLPNRLLSFQTQRGIQYELGFVQSSPTDLTLRNDDGALAPRTGGGGTATANGTTTTLVVSNTDGATMTVGDFFQLKSSGTLKEVNVFQITGISAGTSTTVTFARADGTGGGAQAATATGDTYSACPIDIYLPYRILASWSGVRYPVAIGWIERWPQQWDDPHWGVVQAVGIDTIATLTAADVSTVQGEILRRSPQSYWPLNDGAAATTAQNFGSGTTTLTQTSSTNGTGSNGTAAFGASTQAVNDAGFPGPPLASSIIGDTGTGWSESGLTATELATQGFALVGSPGNDTTFPSIANGVTILGMSFTTSNDMSTIASMTVDPTVMAIRSSSGTGGLATRIKLAITHGAVTPYPNVTVWDKTTGASTTTSCSGGNSFGDRFQLWALVFNQTSWKLYFTSLPGTGIISVGSGTANMGPTFGLIDLNGEADSTTNGRFFNGVVAHVAIFGRMLTAAELKDIWNAMNSGTYAYPATNESIHHKLGFVGWKGARALTVSTVNTGTDILASTIAEKVASLADYEGGRLFSDAGGQLRFTARSRAATQTARATLGDRPDLGEVPYVGGSSDLQVDFDATYVYNTVTLANKGIVTPHAPVNSTTLFTASNTASAAKYGSRTLGKTVSLANTTDVTNTVTYYLNKYSTPQLRLATVKIDAVKSGASVAATWPFVLGVEVGDVVTVKRRPIGAPAISFTCIVLQVTHDVGPDKWDVTLTLAPR